MSGSRARWLIILVVTAAMLPTPVEAQDSPAGDNDRLSGYAFAGVGPYARKHRLEMIGAVTERGNMPLFGAGIEWPLSTVFATGGYSLMSDLEPPFNVGGGVSYWFRGAAGLRVELRHHFAPQPNAAPGTFTSFTQFRLGLSFRRDRRHPATSTSRSRPTK